MGIALVILAAAVIYLVSLKVKPWWRCPRCNDAKPSSQGTGRAHGRCLRCGGNGRYPRVGVKILMPGTARKMRDGEKGTFF